MREAYKKGYEDAKKFAENAIHDFDKTSGILEDATEKLNDKKLGPLAKLVEDIKLMGEIIKAYIKGEYKSVPIASIIGILASLIYVVNPMDVVPDFIPFVGHIDDAAIVMFVLKQFLKDLEAFRIWRSESEEIN